METNVGGYDRTGRFVLGAVLVLVGIVGYIRMVGVAVGPVPQALMALILVVIGAVLLVPGYSRTCPINSAARINTYESEDR
jgi:hypothetical protein